MNEFFLISVIIPTYNLEKYVEKMIDSLKRQTYYNFEAIIIDDGSTDSTVKKIIRSIGLDERFKLIEKENSGVSETRFIGIEKSNGKYICFLDGDDFVDATWLEKFVIDLETSEADIVSIGYSEYYEESSKYIKQSFCNENELLLGDQIIEEWCKDKKIKGFLWNKIFKTSVLKEVYEIVEFSFLEDSYVLLKYLSCIDKMYVDQESLYFYRIRKESLTHKKFNNKDLNVISKFDDLFKVLSKKSCNLSNILSARLAKIQLMIISNMNYQDFKLNKAILLNIKKEVFAKNVEKKKVFNRIEIAILKLGIGNNIAFGYLEIQLRLFLIKIQFQYRKLF